MEMTKHDLRHFGLAKSISESSTYRRHHLGCVVVHKNKHVLSVGWNEVDKTSPLQAKYNKFRNFEGAGAKHVLHAEVHALSKIRGLNVDWSNVEIFVYRQHKDGTKALAKPCKACYQMIKDMGIRTVNYTIEDGYACEKIS